jgi:hypothetical protein
MLPAKFLLQHVQQQQGAYRPLAHTTKPNAKTHLFAFVHTLSQLSLPLPTLTRTAMKAVLMWRPSLSGERLPPEVG